MAVARSIYMYLGEYVCLQAIKTAQASRATRPEASPLGPPLQYSHSALQPLFPPPSLTLLTFAHHLFIMTWSTAFVTGADLESATFPL